MTDTEFKGIVEDLVNKFIRILDMGPMTDLIRSNLKKSYDKGLDDIGVQLNMNFTGFPERFNMLERYTFENIKALQDETADKLRKELSQSLLNIESVGEMKDRVLKVMETTVDRAKMIARTEMNRAENMGHIDGARQSGLKLVKEWDAHLDNRTSPICRYLDKKQVPMDEKFNYQGQLFDMPPAHPNCRSVLVFKRLKE
jgi:SPP1 gp7 family putative phage head morphogenesis protein